MDIKECYKEMGADYEDVLRRMGSDSLVERFTLRFLDDKRWYCSRRCRDGIPRRTYIKRCLSESGF